MKAGLASMLWNLALIPSEISRGYCASRIRSILCTGIFLWAVGSSIVGSGAAALGSFVLIVSPIPSNGRITGAGLNCGSTGTGACSTVLVSEDSVTLTLTAEPAPGYQVGSWSGCPSPNGASCTLSTAGASALIVSVSFTQTTYLLTVSPTPANGRITGAGLNCGSTGTGVCSVEVGSGTAVTLTAEPAPGYQVGSWSGCPSPSGASCTLSMTEARTVSVTFLEAPTLTSPAPLSTLPGGSVTFAWTTGGIGAQEYWLYVGSTVGGYDYFTHREGAALSQIVNGLPTNGSTIYVRLWWRLGPTWALSDSGYADYTFTAASADNPVLTSPAPLSTLPGASTTFAWTTGGIGAQEYWLYVGSTPGGYDYFTHSTGSALSQIVNGLPTDGRPVFVRLWWRLGPTWSLSDSGYADYTFTAFH